MIKTNGFKIARLMPTNRRPLDNWSDYGNGGILFNPNFGIVSISNPDFFVQFMSSRSHSYIDSNRAMNRGFRAGQGRPNGFFGWKRY